MQQFLLTGNYVIFYSCFPTKLMFFSSQTGSGKTFSMGTGLEATVNPEHEGNCAQTFSRL